MLKMKPNCECCDRDLPASGGDAWICSMECTFCTTCVEGVIAGRCPNCGGDLAPRPTRADHLLTKYPPSTERVKRETPCVAPSS